VAAPVLVEKVQLKLALRERVFELSAAASTAKTLKAVIFSSTDVQCFFLAKFQADVPISHTLNPTVTLVPGNSEDNRVGSLSAGKLNVFEARAEAEMLQPLGML
jgi:hypothetical protein